MTGMNGNVEDLELIDSIHNGRTDLFQRLVEKYQKRIYNFGLKICPNPQDAEDMVQESFINVFRYLKDFRRESSFKNWLYLIASSVCHKMKRKSKFAPERELSLEEFIPDDHDSVKKEIPDWAVEPSERLLNRELSNKIQSAIAELPTDYRLVLVLRDMEGFSTEETAGILHITPANVKVRLHRARLFVRNVLKEYYELEPRKHP
ncbi:MAG: RNA polymerase sigma factor [Desulfobacteraceae bacterium]|jgi:RNA polymerase sigma-70 factor (ECF subfamily)